MSEEILVKSWPAVCESLDRESFVVRVHWLPYWIDSSGITYNLSKHGKILKVFNETGATSDPDGRHIKTSIRRIVTVEDRHVLLTIKGRAPLCLKCHHTGHIRSASSTPYCRQCQAFGHCTEDCDSSSSYAAKVRPHVVAPEYVDDRVDPQDVMEVDEVPPGNHDIVSAVVSEPVREEQVVLGSPVVIPHPDTPGLDIGPSPVPSQCSGKRGADDPSLCLNRHRYQRSGVLRNRRLTLIMLREEWGTLVEILLMLGWRVTHPPRPLLLLMRRGRKRVNHLTPPTLSL